MIRNLFKNWFIAKVSGQSMVPVLTDGDFILSRRDFPLETGQVVLVKHPEYGLLVKRVESVFVDHRFQISGDNVHSTTTESFGTMEKDSYVGRVIFRFYWFGFSKV